METPATFSWLDEYLESTEKSLGQMDLATLSPTSWRHTQPLFATQWLDWFYRIVQSRRKQQIPFETLAPFFPPDLCREHLFFTLEDLKVAKWPENRRMEVADFFYQLLKSQMEPDDLFGLKGSTRPKLDLGSIQREKFQTGTPDAARALGRLYNAAYNLSTTLYLDYYMGNGIENYGPYPLADGRILVVKDMRHLCPTELWPDFSGIPNHFRLYCIYRGVSFSTTLIACHGNYQGDPIAGLEAWRLEVDGKPVGDLEFIQQATRTLAEKSSRQWKRVLALSEPELIGKSVWIRCYVFKPLCDRLGLEWRPTPGLLDAVKGKTLQDGWSTWNPPEGRAAKNAYWRKIWDPRIDFYPGGKHA